MKPSEPSYFLYSLNVTGKDAILTLNGTISIFRMPTPPPYLGQEEVPKRNKVSAVDHDNYPEEDAEAAANTPNKPAIDSKPQIRVRAPPGGRSNISFF